MLPRLRRLAHALVCEPAKADELVWAVVERAASEIGHLRQDIGPEIQLIAMLRNLWIEHREEWQSVLPLEPTTELEKVTQAMAALPSAQREAVALVVIDELQYRDAAGHRAGVGRDIVRAAGRRPRGPGGNAGGEGGVKISGRSADPRSGSTANSTKPGPGRSSRRFRRMRC